MKNFRHLIAIMAAILISGAVHAQCLDTQCSKWGKDPWQIMQTTLYNHYVDTTGLSVDSPIDYSLVLEIWPDLEQAYYEQANVYADYTTLGDVICAFMNVKYAGLSGETYDYYKIRYSSRPSYALYLENYPNSPYAEEIRLKKECIDQILAWASCDLLEDYRAVYDFYGPSYCPYGGFSNIANRNNILRGYLSDYLSFFNDEDDDCLGNSCKKNKLRYNSQKSLRNYENAINTLLEVFRLLEEQDEDEYEYEM